MDTSALILMPERIRIKTFADDVQENALAAGKVMNKDAAGKTEYPFREPAPDTGGGLGSGREGRPGAVGRKI